MMRISAGPWPFDQQQMQALCASSVVYEGKYPENVEL